MKRKNWKVGDYGIRPAGKPDECFYCHEPKGGIHKPDCVIRRRTILIEMKVELVVAKPETWTVEQIERFFNESSSCQSNLIGALEELSGRVGCLCGFVEVRQVRDATAADEKRQKLFVKELEA